MPPEAIVAAAGKALVDHRIYTIRLRKMGEVDAASPRYIQTVWGVGYVFVPDGAS